MDPIRATATEPVYQTPSLGPAFLQSPAAIEAFLAEDTRGRRARPDGICDIRLAFDKYRGGFELSWPHPDNVDETSGRRELARRRFHYDRRLNLFATRESLALEGLHVPLRHHGDFSDYFSHREGPRTFVLDSRFGYLPLRAACRDGSLTLWFVYETPWNRPTWTRESLGNVDVYLHTQATSFEATRWWARPACLDTHGANTIDPEVVSLVGITFTDRRVTPHTAVRVTMDAEDIK